MEKIAALLRFFSSGYSVFFSSKLSKLIHACEGSENLMISIYHIEEKRFLYVNKTFEKRIGDHYNQLLREDWSFWFSIIHENDVLKVKHKLFSFLKSPSDQASLTLNYTVTNYQGSRISLKHEISLHKLELQTLAINYFFDISGKEQIEECFNHKKNRAIQSSSKKSETLISTRENEVLQLIANGFSSKQIADLLFISNHTAISHRKNLIEKFKVKNTAHLIKEASKIIEL